MVAQQKQKAVSDGRQIFIYIQISDARQGKTARKQTDMFGEKNGVLDSYSFQIISQEAGMGGWQQESKLICFKENCILGLGFKLIDCYIWKR